MADTMQELEKVIENVNDRKKKNTYMKQKHPEFRRDVVSVCTHVHSKASQVQRKMLRTKLQIRRLLRIPSYYIIFYLIRVANVVLASDLWPMDRPDGMPSIQSLEVMCGKDHMDVHLTFSQPFEGIVSSKGQHGDPRCVYVPPSSKQTLFSFRIAYARCGTKPDLHGQYYENTVVVQYDKDLLEVWDEAKRLRCEWFNDYEKTASKPPMVIADLDVIQLDFRGDNVDCWMEIQHGKGPWAPPVSGIVSLGSTLTLVVAINDHRGEFDMRVKSCLASDGAGHVIQLSDEFGCVLRPKMISRFLKARGSDERASVITYAFFHAFKFPDALSVHIKCKVEICRHGCLDHCQIQSDEAGDINPELSLYENNLDKESLAEDRLLDTLDGKMSDDTSYEDIVQENGDVSLESKFPTIRIPYNDKLSNNRQSQLQDSGKAKDQLDVTNIDSKPIRYKEIHPIPLHDEFPHGPRTLEEEVNERNTHQKASDMRLDRTGRNENNYSTSGASKRFEGRRKRSVVVSDRKARSTDVGVSSLYEVISEADLAFSPDSRAEAVTVFRGRIREEVVYGICMPVPGFSLLFVVVTACAVVSALVAGSLLYRYQLQNHHLNEQGRSQRGHISMNFFSNWMRSRLMSPRSSTETSNSEQNINIDHPVVLNSEINGKSVVSDS
ncbi:hypothetical protein JTB14_037807 [Gonioctena quinquepunctata]|nr:hypothetical protein JTB14_037807 [Gonioctena quinquepunctata]